MGLGLGLVGECHPDSAPATPPAATRRHGLPAHAGILSVGPDWHFYRVSENRSWKSIFGFVALCGIIFRKFRFFCGNAIFQLFKSLEVAAEAYKPFRTSYDGKLPTLGY